MYGITAHNVHIHFLYFTLPQPCGAGSPILQTRKQIQRGEVACFQVHKANKKKSWDLMPGFLILGFGPLYVLIGYY